MAVITDSLNATKALQVEGGLGAARVAVVPRGIGYGTAATSGTIAAALAANSTVFAMRLDPGSTRAAFIERVRLEVTTIVAFTVPVTAGRRLALYRGSGAASAGGTAIATATPKHSTVSPSEFNAALGGDIRIATTGALTVTGITFEAERFREMSLTHVGAAGAFRDLVWEFSASESQPIQLDPGQLIAVRNPVVMDAAGTWQLAVSVDWYEADAMDWTV
jgi:hypothetical protein